MKRTLYIVQGDSFWGDDREQKRADQLAVVASLGLAEFEDRRILCEADDALRLLVSGYCGNYLSPKDNCKPVGSFDAGPDVQKLFGVLADKIATMPSESINERCGQHQPNSALLNIAETRLLEDSCTDVLQENLANGWRILAVQPQPDQRRPDYILGRPLMSAMRG